MPQPEAHYRSGFNGRPYETRGCVVRFRVVFLLSFFLFNSLLYWCYRLVAGCLPVSGAHSRPRPSGTP
ncbi:hypothetical protein D7M35_01490 [Salmonella enterica]|nr:hypothetical protein [Salmonella enterica]